jgi:hypothetical protein
VIACAHFHYLFCNFLSALMYRLRYYIDSSISQTSNRVFINETMSSKSVSVTDIFRKQLKLDLITIHIVRDSTGNEELMGIGSNHRHVVHVWA